jgi:SAM-dependent methyltransferase
MAKRPDFSQRAELTELMDAPCSFEQLRDCLRHLAWVNRLTRAHRPVMLWVEGVAASYPTSENPDVGHPRDRPLKIVDVGCGYGDLLRGIERWAGRRGVAVELVGVDVNANSVRAAREATSAASRITWVHGDASACVEAAGADLVTATGMMHHLPEAEIARLLEWMEGTARVGWFIVDLHRKPVPYRAFSALMRGAWWHPFIRPDGLASIRRSFVAEDWLRMCSAAGLDAGAVAIREHRPARLSVGRMKAAWTSHPSR